MAIAAILILNGCLGACQKSKADEAFTKTKKLGAARVQVLRDGKLQRIHSNRVVSGELLRTAAGDRVAADSEVVQSKSLSMDASPLRGESLPIERTEGEEIPAGALVVRGICYAPVPRIGAISAVGKLAGSLGRMHKNKPRSRDSFKRFHSGSRLSSRS